MSAPRSLWDFAIAVYGKESVPASCLALQDGYGADVNLLLFAAWAGAERGIALDAPAARLAAARVAEWHGEIVKPLRHLRQKLKSGPSPAPDEATESLRNRIKAAELASERIELDWLERHAEGAPSQPNASPAENLRAVLALTAGPERTEEVEHHLAVIEKAAVSV